MTEGSGLHPRQQTLERQLYDALELHGQAWEARNHRLWRQSLRAIMRVTKRLGYVQRQVDEQRAKLLGHPPPPDPWDTEDTPAVSFRGVKG